MEYVEVEVTYADTWGIGAERAFNGCWVHRAVVQVPEGKLNPRYIPREARKVRGFGRVAYHSDGFYRVRGMHAAVWFDV